jgi:hypothetical protein
LDLYGIADRKEGRKKERKKEERTKEFCTGRLL